MMFNDIRRTVEARAHVARVARRCRRVLTPRNCGRYKGERARRPARIVHSGCQALHATLDVGARR
jgi:hypothetical protein